MFLARVPAVAYSDPWALPFDRRRAWLLRGSPRVAYYYDRPDNSTFRYRAYNMVQVLRERGSGVGAAFFRYEELDLLLSLVGEIDVLVVCRAKYSDALNRLIVTARGKGKRVLYDVDDLVFDCDFVPLLVNTLDQDVSDPHVWDAFFGYVAQVGAALKLCEGAITTNDFLASRLREWTGNPVAVVPNFLNREQLEVSRRIYEKKRASGFARDGRITLGYFSGTPTHNRDLQIAVSAIGQLMRRDDRLRLRVVGFMDMKGPLREIADRVETLPLQDFVNLQRLIGEVEVNLVPLQDNTFTNCKSELKYFEAGIVGTVTVASPVHAYAEAIRDGRNGFLARAHEWEATVASLIERMDDYPAIAERAFEHSERCYAWIHQLPAIERALFG